MQKQDDSNISQPWLNHYPVGIDWHMPFAACAVHDFMRHAEDKFADRPAFDFLGKKWTWRQIAIAVDRVAAALQTDRVGKGVKVGLLLPNSPYYLIAYYAVLRTGATVVNLNPLYAVKELTQLVEDSETEVLITVDLAMVYDKVRDLKTSKLRLRIVASFCDILPFPKNILFRLFNASKLADLPETTSYNKPFSEFLSYEGKPDPVKIDPHSDVAVIQYTGGTTGTPKGAMLTHANVSINAQQAVAWFDGVKNGEDKMLGVLPFFHVFAMTVVMNLSVICGLEIIGLPRFDLVDTVNVIHRKRPTCFPAVPAIYNAIAHYPKIKRFDLSSLRVCIAGGAPLPGEVKVAFEKISGCRVREGYGLTEASPVLCMNPIVGEDRTGTIGQPLPGTTIELIGVDDGKPVPIGQPGELCARGPQIMKGYYNKPTETAEVLREGRLHTGDVATMSADGYFTIVDRIKDMIITNGYKVWPKLVEEAIYANPAVEECIVAGIPDAARGEVPKAWIKLKEGQTASGDEIKAFLKDKISPMEIPKQIEIRDKPLPKTTIGKLSRKDVLAEEQAATGGK
jgi:long-chain acyl-CoA synthetase